MGLERRRLLPGLAIAAAASFLLRRALLSGETLFWRDVSFVWLPQAEVIVRCLAQGSLPLWDAWTGFGRPLLADPRAEIFYPLAWLNLLLPPARFYTLFVAAHLVLGGLGAYRLARALGSGRAAASLGGVAFAASGPLPSLALTWHHLAGAAWMPWVLAAGLRACAPAPSIVPLALALALQIFAGSPDYTLLTLLATGALAAGEAAALGGRPGLRALIGPGAGVLAGLALAAPQWLPTLLWSQGSARQTLSREAAAVWSLHPLQLLEVAAPFRIWQLPLSPEGVVGLLEGREPWLHSIHLGAGVLALALVGLRGRRALALGIVGLAAAAFALGHHSPFFELALELVPPLGLLRFPVKAMALAALAACVLAAAGLERIATEAAPRRRAAILIAAVAAGAAGCAGYLAARQQAFSSAWLRAGSDAALAGPRDALLLAAAAAGLLALACARARGRRGLLLVAALLVLGPPIFTQRNLMATAPARLFTTRPPALRALDPNGRLYAQDQIVRPGALAVGDLAPRLALAEDTAGLPPLAAAVLGLNLALNPPTAARWGVAGSFDRDILGFEPPALSRLNDRLRALEAEPAAHARLLRAGAVTDVASLTPGPWAEALEPNASFATPFRRPLLLWRVPRPLPRASVVTGVRIAPEASVLDALSSAGFDPAREVILASGKSRAPQGTGRVLRLSLEPNRILVELEAEAPAHLVLVDAWDAGWSARVDGNPAPILRANSAFRAIPVPAGPHRVELRYWPPGLTAGVALAAAAALALGLVLARSRRGGAPASASLTPLPPAA